MTEAMAFPGLEAPTMERTAVLSEDGRYRYLLGRRWGEGSSVTWVMLNPSKGDDTIDDQTLRKCVGFAKRWGHGAIEVVNLFAVRSRDPSILAGHPDPVGPDNDRHVQEALARAVVTVAGWGGGIAYAEDLGQTRSIEVRNRSGVQCLGRTAGGEPRHPVMLPYSTPLEPAALRSARA